MGFFKQISRKAGLAMGIYQQLCGPGEFRERGKTLVLEQACLRVFGIQRGDKKEENDAAFLKLELRIVGRLNRQDL